MNICENCIMSYATGKNYGAVYACAYNFDYTDQRYTTKTKCNKFKQCSNLELKNKQEEMKGIIDFMRSG